MALKDILLAWHVSMVTLHRGQYVILAVVFAAPTLIKSVIKPTQINT